MKRIILPAALAATLATGPALAGSLGDPVVETDLIVSETTATSSAAGTGLILFLAAVMAAATSD
ncbi:hypothetical protein [Marimonas lutisalis]|uniref:hypothetical protein n=1 Tax=Marimonas lutisalis TaxID=2545756 RepID=UPI0010FA0FB4|nr:hypothetical protein [Marimonas lutisalis]